MLGSPVLCLVRHWNVAGASSAALGALAATTCYLAGPGATQAQSSPISMQMLSLTSSPISPSYLLRPRFHLLYRMIRDRIYRRTSHKVPPKWTLDFGDNLFGLGVTLWCSVSHFSEVDFVKEIAVCLYIRSMSSTSWIVQDIRHKLGRFNFFIKILIVHIFNHLRGSVHKLHIYTRPLFDDDKKGKNIDTEDLRLVEPLEIILEFDKTTHMKAEGLKSTEEFYKGGLESVSTRRIQGIGYGVLEFLGVGPRLISSRIFTYYISNTAYWASLDTAY
ncbi:hypothetical protein Tco_1345788 [Tanacetum coccineum]